MIAPAKKVSPARRPAILRWWLRRGNRVCAIPLLMPWLVLALFAGCRVDSAFVMQITSPRFGSAFEGGCGIAFTGEIIGNDGQAVQYVWNFGDGTRLQGKTVTHAYDKQGIYRVIFTAEDELGRTGTDSVFIIISPSRFVKLNENGNELPETALQWVMVRDAATGLVWEMKEDRDYVHNYQNPRDADNTYTWYDENPATNGGDPGVAGDGTDTQDFIETLNGSRLGGCNDWRMPSCEELKTIADGLRFNPAINTDYFPATVPWYYWSSTTYEEFDYAACHISFLGSPPSETVVIQNHNGYKSIAYCARGVRGPVFSGQQN